MPARSQFVQFAAKFGILVGAIFVVTVFLSAMPGHHAPAFASQQSHRLPAAEPQQPSPGMDAHSPGMDMDDVKLNEAHAVHDMSPGRHAPNAHMRMTAARPPSSEDVARAKEIVEQLRDGIAKYKDYRVALADSYKIFLPNLKQPEYHFTNYKNGFFEAFTFKPSRPTSLLYKKTSTGYELVGAMYTMPKRATEDELNERIPLSLATWHLHSNLCMPPRDQLSSADWTKFGLRGSISTEEGCHTAGGRFHPVIFGWMVHVYPYEDSLDKIFTIDRHD